MCVLVVIYVNVDALVDTTVRDSYLDVAGKSHIWLFEIVGPSDFRLLAERCKRCATVSHFFPVFFFLSRQPSLSLSFELRVEYLLSQLMCANDHLFFTYVGILE